MIFTALFLTLLSTTVTANTCTVPGEKWDDKYKIDTSSINVPWENLGFTVRTNNFYMIRRVELDWDMFPAKCEAICNAANGECAGWKIHEKFEDRGNGKEWWNCCHLVSECGAGLNKDDGDWTRSCCGMGEPTNQPTPMPSVFQGPQPTEQPVEPPTQFPTGGPPTEHPTGGPPTEHPTEGLPTAYPTEGIPTAFPTEELPTAHPTAPPPTERPTGLPTSEPTAVPTTRTPTASPTRSPTSAPTRSPTAIPTTAPTRSPTMIPTTAPTRGPTTAPTRGPTTAPTRGPTTAPTRRPTSSPTRSPTSVPTPAPTSVPTSAPTTADPTMSPTWLGETMRPTKAPTTKAPTTAPSAAPTQSPVSLAGPVPITGEDGGTPLLKKPAFWVPVILFLLLLPLLYFLWARYCKKKDQRPSLLPLNLNQHGFGHTVDPEQPLAMDTTHVFAAAPIPAPPIAVEPGVMSDDESMTTRMITMPSLPPAQDTQPASKKWKIAL